LGGGRKTLKRPLRKVIAGVEKGVVARCLRRPKWNNPGELRRECYFNSGDNQVLRTLWPLD
jgi:hypothetical protein